MLFRSGASQKYLRNTILCLFIYLQTEVPRGRGKLKVLDSPRPNNPFKVSGKEEGVNFQFCQEILKITPTTCAIKCLTVLSCSMIVMVWVRGEDSYCLGERRGMMVTGHRSGRVFVFIHLS